MSCCPGLLPLKLFHEAREELELLGGIQSFQPVLLDDLFEPLTQRLIEDRVFLHPNIDLVADGVLHLARLGVVGLQRLDLLIELRREELDFLDQNLDAVSGDGVRDQLPDLSLRSPRDRGGRPGSGRARPTESCPASGGRPDRAGRAGPEATCPWTG